MFIYTCHLEQRAAGQKQKQTQREQILTDWLLLRCFFISILELLLPIHYSPYYYYWLRRSGFESQRQHLLLVHVHFNRLTTKCQMFAVHDWNELIINIPIFRVSCLLIFDYFSVFFFLCIKYSDNQAPIAEYWKILKLLFIIHTN